VTKTASLKIQDGGGPPSTILKIVKSPHLSEKSSNFDEIWYSTADIELMTVT